MKYTEHSFFFDFESSANEKEKTFFVKVETDIEDGGYYLWIYPDNTCAYEITQLIKDIDIDLYNDIDRAAHQKSEDIRDESVVEWDEYAV